MSPSTPRTKPMPSVFCAFLATMVVGLAACSGTESTSGVPDACHGYASGEGSREFSPCRVFRGRLQLPSAKDLTLPSSPFQILGLVFERQAKGSLGTDGGAPASDDAAPDPSTLPGPPTDQVSPRFFYGDPFVASAGAGQRPAVPFSIVVPCSLSVNLMLQILRSSGDKEPGFQVAQVTFPRPDAAGTMTTLIPRQTPESCGGKANQLDLGLVALTLGQRGVLASGSLLLGKGNSKNPLDLVPLPEETVTDQDQDGDGILDSAETFAALPDRSAPGLPPDETTPHPDGVPDLFQ